MHCVYCDVYQCQSFIGLPETYTVSAKQLPHDK